MITAKYLHAKALARWLCHYVTLPALETYLVGQGWQTLVNPYDAGHMRFFAPVTDGMGKTLAYDVRSSYGPVYFVGDIAYLIDQAAAIEEREPLDVVRDILAAAQPESLLQLDAWLTTHCPKEYLE